jgi:beta-lactam-binding protein with PASTA domain
MALSAATNNIADANCRTGTIGHAYSKKMKKGRVFSQSPKAGATLPARSRVNLIVSRGPRPKPRRYLGRH